MNKRGTINKFFNFIKLTHKLQKVKRIILVKDENRLENDLEHQYQLALFTWYIIESEKLKLNINKAIKYALVHDIVEAYAGDTLTFANPDKIALQRRKEIIAIRRLKKGFPEFRELHKLIKAYEERIDKESKFVYALDKILPIYNNYLNDGKTWKKYKITLAMVKSKKEKIKIFPQSIKYFNLIIKRLQKEEKRLFN